MERRPKRWTREETKAFLNFYAARKAEFEQMRKRRIAYANIREDMVSAGYDSSITVHQLQTLIRAYKNAKDNARATGASPCIPPFYVEMDEIFGDKPNHSASQSINVGVDFLLSDLDAPISQPTPSSSSEFISIEVEEIFLEEETFAEEVVPDISATSDEASAASPSPSSSSSGTIRKKRNLSRSDFYKETLRQRQEDTEAAEARFQKRFDQKQEALKQKKDSHREKCELFEKFVFNFILSKNILLT